MDAKEKAENLIAQYLPICQYKMGMDREYVLGKAKECALIAVDEILGQWEYYPHIPEEGLFWQEVKSEIEKL